MICGVSLMNRAKVLSIVFSLLSIAMLLYYTIQPKVKAENDLEYHLKDFLQIIAPSLTLVTNLLLYQAVIDIHHQSLYYWPKPKYCLLTWLFVHSTVTILLTHELVYCFYSIHGKYSLSTSGFATCFNQQTTSKVLVIFSTTLFIFEEILIIIGMKIVLEVLSAIQKRKNLIYNL